MKSIAVFVLLFLFSLPTFAQNPRTKIRKAKKPVVIAINPGDEKEELAKAIAVADLAERIAALQKFDKDFPKSIEKNRALELIVSARAALADEKLRASDAAGGIELFKLAVRDAPKPISEKLYTDVIIQIPTNLFFRDERGAAVETARLIEEKTEGNAKQILGLAAFYLNLENAAEAKRLADQAVELDPTLPAAYQTLGLAHRLNFQLEDAAAAYQKALELDANSAISKRSLAEMKRAVGKPAEAVALYREIAAKDEKDGAAQTGLILALFEAENKTEAETELQKSLEANPNNLFLLVGAAYWYAAHEQGAKAVELAEKAVAIEPRYTWAHIALARGLILQNRPLEAEKALLVAGQYGSFPTLDYEIAAARFQSGFYREAAEGLQKNFALKNGLIETKLGGRVSVEAKNFVELLSLERRASIFQPTAASTSETADQLKSLLDLQQKLDISPNDEAIVSQAADEFIRGDDRMKLHRQLYVANRLLDEKANLPKVLELTKAAISGVNAALDVPNPAAAVLADELYDNRKLAMTRSELIIVPEVSRQTLSNILRGRIEDLSGWALYQENKPSDAVIRLKRAVSVLPEKSSWWRASMWRLGAALDADGKSNDALEAYIKSYTNSEANPVKYSIVETLYQKVNGNLDGLEAKIGAKPASMAVNYPVKTETPAARTATETPNEKTEKANPYVEITSALKTETSKTPLVVESPRSETTAKPTSEVETNQTIPTETEAAPSSEPKPEESAPTETKVETTIEETAPVKADLESKAKETAPTEDEIAPKPEELTPVEDKIESKPAEISKEVIAEAAPKSLFEPIVINVPKPTNKSAESTQETKPPVENVESRPRVAIEKETEPLPQCKIVVSEETISVINGGGVLSVLINLEGEGDLKQIKASSSDPNDVEVVLQPPLNDDYKRGLFFIVKSISRKTGEYTLTFEAPCGKKDISVKVR